MVTTTLGYIHSLFNSIIMIIKDNLTKLVNPLGVTGGVENTVPDEAPVFKTLDGNFLSTEDTISVLLHPEAGIT